MSLHDELDLALAAVPEPDPRDAAARELARRLARQIDRSAAIAAAADAAVREAGGYGDEGAEIYEQLVALRAKLAEINTLDRIGARLAALLLDLQLTPRARGVAAKATAAGHPAGTGTGAGKSALAVLKGGL